MTSLIPVYLILWVLIVGAFVQYHTPLDARPAVLS
jgi:hypothetical protein